MALIAARRSTRFACSRVLGLALLAYARTVGVGDGLAEEVMGTAIYTTLGWSVLNLLPILPLDGGQTLRELLPGSPAKRAAAAFDRLVPTVQTRVDIWIDPFKDPSGDGYQIVQSLYAFARGGLLGTGLGAGLPTTLTGRSHSRRP